MEESKTIDEVNIDDTIKKATREAIREYTKELKNEQRKKTFQNTRLLMKNYNDLKKHAEKAIDSLKFALYHGEYEDLTEDEVYILSIKQSKAKTLIMIAHIDIAMGILEEKQKNACTYEKYQAIEKYYIKGYTYEDIAIQLHCSEITARRWINEMTNQLGVLLFGIDGLKSDMIG